MQKEIKMKIPAVNNHNQTHKRVLSPQQMENFRKGSCGRTND